MQQNDFLSSKYNDSRTFLFICLQIFFYDMSMITSYNVTIVQ